MTQEITRAPQQALTMTDEINFANTVARGSLLPQAYRNSPANVVIAINLGQSMGLSPAESLYRINVIQGKPTASAELIAAQVRKAGHKLRIQKDEANQSVTATIVRCDDPDYPFRETRDAEWAKRMGLANKDNYRKQPMTMLTWRAITAVAREACPEALYGVAYTPDEMHDMDPQPVQDIQAVDLSKMRKAYAAYRNGNDMTNQTAVEAVCKGAGIKNMRNVTQEEADRATAWMEANTPIVQEHKEPEPVQEQVAQAIEEADPAAHAVATDGAVFIADQEPEVELADADMSW